MLILWDFLQRQLCHLQTKTVLFSPSLPSVYFISFSLLIGLARTCRTTVNGSVYGGHPCLVLSLRGTASSVLLLSTGLVGQKVHLAFFRKMSLVALNCL